MGCGAIRPKRTLVRLALQDGSVVRDERTLRQGRGAYVCDAACYEKAVASRAFPRAFRQAVRPSGETLESLDT